MHLSIKYAICLSAISLFSCAIGSRHSYTPRPYSAQNTCKYFNTHTNQKSIKPSAKKKIDDAIQEFGGSGIEIINWMKSIAKKGCAEPYEAYYNWISNDTLKAEGNSNFYQKIVNEIGTAIHETAHSFSKTAGYGDPRYAISTGRKGIIRHKTPASYTAVYLKGNGVLFVFHTATFPSAKITPLIIDKKLTSDMRYREYIKPSSQYQTTQIQGIYGLLDEYHAYKYNQIVNYNILKKEKKDKVTTQKDRYLATLQFCVYILTYFRTAQKYYPDVYKSIINNKDLLYAIINIHDESSEIRKKYLALIEKKGGVFFKDKYDRTLKEYQLPANQKMLSLIRKGARF